MADLMSNKEKALANPYPNGRSLMQAISTEGNRDAQLLKVQQNKIP